MSPDTDSTGRLQESDAAEGITDFAAALHQRLGPGGQQRLDALFAPAVLDRLVRTRTDRVRADKVWRSETIADGNSGEEYLDKLLVDSIQAPLRRNLLIVGAVAVFIGLTRAVPQSVNALGIDLSGSPKAIEWLLLLTVAYQTTHYFILARGSRSLALRALSLIKTYGTAHRRRELTFRWILEQLRKSGATENDEPAMTLATTMIDELAKANSGRRTRVLWRCLAAVLVEFYLPLAVGVVGTLLAARLLVSASK